jgi:hypothetical protein
MKFRLMVMTAAVALAPVFGLTGKAHAIVADAGLTAPGLTEQAACRVIRSRIVAPNGRVTYKTVRRCGGPVVMQAPACKTVRERIVRPNGSIVFKTVKRCR